MRSEICWKLMILAVILIFCRPTLAQDVPQNCGDLCVCVSDTSCTSLTGCDANGEDCQSTTFSVSDASGCDLKLEVFLPCSDCEHCFACAVIVNQSGQWVGGVQTGCDANGCTHGTTVNLPAGTYRLQACLRRCPTPDTCAQCSRCTANARVYDTSDDCDAPCNW